MFGSLLVLRYIPIVLRQRAKATSLRKEPLVGVIVDTGSSYGRQLLRGVLQYANLQRRWQIHVELRPRPETLDHWPRCDGAVFGGGGAVVFDYIRTRGSKFIISCSGGADPQLSPVVSLDAEAAGELAASHLLDCRLEHFAFY